MLEMLKCHLHVPPTPPPVDMKRLFWQRCKNRDPVLSCNDPTAATFTGTRPVTPQVEKAAAAPALPDRQTPLWGMGQK